MDTWITIVYYCTLIIQGINAFEVQLNATCHEPPLYTISVKNQTHTLWYLISASLHHPPSLILIHTYGESQVHVNCTLFQSSDTSEYRKSVSVDNIIRSYGWILHRIIRYNDTNDKAIAPDKGLATETFLGSNLDWTVVSTPKNTNTTPLTIEFEARKSLDPHEKIDGVIKLKFTIYDYRTKPSQPLYYTIENALSIVVELILDKVEVINSVNKFSPVLLIFSNHSLEDDAYFWNKTAVQKYAEDGPIGKIKSPFIQLGLELSKEKKLIQSIWPNAYLQFPAAYWIDPQQQTQQAQLVRFGIARPIDHTIIKTKSYHFSLPFAVYGDNFTQIHDQSTKNHVAVREQVINLGSPNTGYYYARTNYSSWTMIFGLGDPDIIPSDDDDDTNNGNNEKSVISATVCGILIMVSVIIGVHTIRRLKRRSYQRISEFVNNNNNNNEDVDTDSSLLSAAAATSALMPPSMIDNHIVEPFQYEKLITPQPNHQLINNNYHNVIINENDYLQNNNMSSVNLNSYPPPYGSITGDY